nr:MAG TPA: hypothetical protein [Caudoviricetes sp.]
MRSQRSIHNNASPQMRTKKRKRRECPALFFQYL